jgi:hypothetical protein
MPRSHREKVAQRSPVPALLLGRDRDRLPEDLVPEGLHGHLAERLLEFGGVDGVQADLHPLVGRGEPGGGVAVVDADDL